VEHECASLCLCFQHHLQALTLSLNPQLQLSLDLAHITHVSYYLKASSLNVDFLPGVYYDLSHVGPHIQSMLPSIEV
jgi:hypothetical protein